MQRNEPRHILSLPWLIQADCYLLGVDDVARSHVIVAVVLFVLFLFGQVAGRVPLRAHFIIVGIIIHSITPPLCCRITIRFLLRSPGIPGHVGFMIVIIVA